MSDLGFSETISDQILNETSLIDYPKNVMIEKSLNKFYVKNPNIEKIYLPVFELVEGRIVNYTSRTNGLLSYGFQHGPLGQKHLWRFIFSLSDISKYTKKFIPNKIFVDSEFEMKLFRDRSVTNVIVSKSPRYKNTFSKTSISKKNFKKNDILVILDLHNHKALTKFIVNFAKYNNTKRFIIRKHPRIDKLNQDISGINNLIEDKNDNLFKTISSKNINMVITGDTGATFDLSYHGIPCIIIESNESYCNNPIVNGESNIEIINIDNSQAANSVANNLDKELLNLTRLQKNISKKRFSKNDKF